MVKTKKVNIGWSEETEDDVQELNITEDVLGNRGALELE